ncbi:hypothetical protein GCM10008905_02390 [Clostridium malenominatum]|uniref:Uncharacterized protein n=1 Tax=Clostridium malenominatum TaxID=1539 RepID=A0ABN1IM43_9CLOT
MDIINRYVYAVTRNLPEKQREDIEKELKTLIDDMIEELEESEPYESKVKKVLLELGDPEVLADNYRGSKRYLIGPKNYDKYITILKIVLGAVFIGISIGVIVGSIVDNTQNIVSIFSNYLGALFSALLQGFAWTTVGFAIAERNNANDAGIRLQKDKWTLSELPIIPEKKAIISPIESVVAILFSTIFMAIFYFSPELFAAYIQNSKGISIIPVFNLEIVMGYKIFFVIIFILSILKEVLKLISRRWTLKLAASFTFLSVISTILMLIVFTNPGVWNPDFAGEIIKYTNLSVDFSNLWSRLTSSFIIIMIIACILEVSTALYKGVKYNVTKQ